MGQPIPAHADIYQGLPLNSLTSTSSLLLALMRCEWLDLGFYTSALQSEIAFLPSTAYGVHLALFSAFSTSKRGWDEKGLIVPFMN